MQLPQELPTGLTMATTFWPVRISNAQREIDDFLRKHIPVSEG
jgi:phage-related protein